MTASTINTQRQALEKRSKVLSVTIGVASVSCTRDGIKFLPAGSIIGQDTTADGLGTKINFLLNRAVIARPSNTDMAFGILTHDLYFSDGVNREATICYAGVAYKDVVEDSLTEIKGSADTVHADAITAMPEITFKLV